MSNVPASSSTTYTTAQGDDHCHEIAVNYWAESSPAASSSSRTLNATDLGHTSDRDGARTSMAVSGGRTGLRSRKSSAHRRTATADGSDESHPLQKSLSRGSTKSADGTVTRPTLRRWLSAGNHSDDGSSESHEEGEVEVKKESEAMVIVHEVSRTDSLAGVALKYGISLADLRKVNHMWSSDPIHLRKVLYIPLLLTNKKHAHVAILGHLPGGEDDQEFHNADSRSSAIVQRVPISQLAFFPPPSRSEPAFKDIPSIAPHNPPYRDYNATFSPRSTRARSATSSYVGASPSLSSFLQSLNVSLPPLPVPRSREQSTAAALFSRLSLDSFDASSSGTGTSTATANASEASSDQEHEMDVLDSQQLARDRERTPTQKKSSIPSSLRSDLFVNSVPTVVQKRSARDMKYDASQMALVPPTSTTPARLQTEQMKPSPRMELPRSLRRSDG